MALSNSQLIIGVIVIFIGYSIFQVWSLKDKVYCTFIRRDTTEINKYEKIKSAKITFDNAYYNIVPDRVTLKLVWCGIIPTWVKCLKFKWDSNMPINPKDWNNTYDKPEDRKALNRTEAIQSLNRKQEGILTGKGGKQGMLEKLMPVLVIAGFLILGWITYQLMGKVDQTGLAMNTIQQQLLDLKKSMGK